MVVLKLTFRTTISCRKIWDTLAKVFKKFPGHNLRPFVETGQAQYIIYPATSVEIIGWGFRIFSLESVACFQHTAFFPILKKFESISLEVAVGENSRRRFLTFRSSSVHLQLSVKLQFDTYDFGFGDYFQDNRR